MKRRLMLSAVALVAFAIVAAGATTASAHPTYTSACSGCHGSSTAVKVTVTQTANNGTNATYHVSVTGGSGSVGWAVLEGATSRAHASNGSSAFTVPVGHTYRVWGVWTNDGANSIALAPTAPAPTPTPTPTPTPVPSTVPTGTITMRSSAPAIYLRGAVVLSGRLIGGRIGDRIVISVKKPGSTRWVYLTARLVYAANGAFSYRYVPPARGRYYFKANYLGSTHLKACVTPTIGLRVL